MKQKNPSSESAIEVTELSARSDRATLRQRLADRLRQVIGNPVIEQKELAAFDIVMSRRDVLKLGRNSLVVAGLVSAGVPPTVWARRDPSLGVHPCEVGLTAEEQASVSRAAQLGIGTELFEQTIYAEPVVSPQAGATHAVIEGARHRYRLQSELDSINPAEADFLDNGHHWGPPELVQLEETPSGWELVHYRHPWSAREDGATTDGMVRDVIMTAADGLSDPVKVLTISSPYNNLVTADGMSGAAYIIVVIDRKADATGFLCVGTGTWSMSGATDAPPDYPVQWKSMGLPYVLREVTGTKMWWDDKYVEMGHTDSKHPAEYIPAKSTEHIVLYYPNGPRVITLADNGTPGYAYIWVDMLVYPLAGQPTPTFDTTPRLIHLQTDTNVPASGNSPPYRTYLLVFGSNVKNSDGSYDFTTVTVSTNGSTQREELDIWPDKGIYGRNQQYGAANQQSHVTKSRAQPPYGQQLDYTHVFNVHAFYGTDDGYWLKLAYFENVGVALFVVFSEGSSTYLTGHFPLALPDIDGIGNITTLTGGVSKFDGFRFIASDADGNLFLLRHRRAFSSNTPYSAPIYGFNDAEGNPRTYYAFGVNDPLPDGVDANSNLHDLDAWMAASNEDQYEAIEARNVLLNAVLAFATDDTALAQGIWLGNTYQAAYAPRRFPFDSAFVVIQRAQDGSDADYAAYTMHNNVVTKTWHTRQIATQVLPKDPGLNESGDHYHATVTPLNVYGRPVSLLTSDNANLAIEVRADAPMMVVDDTHNLYYDIDRYTSFMAIPDPGSGRLSLAVKADNFSSVIYVRLVDTSGLTPSASDPAMLAATEIPYPWQSANLAAQAQQRMGNDLSDTVALLGDAAPLADTTQYISGDSLTKASQDGNWDFKGGFKPSTGNSGNLGSLATYLNTSGQTMLGASPQLSLGASTDGVTINPLTAVTSTAPGTDISGGARFAYRSGTVTPTTTSTLLSRRRRPIDSDLGSIWSSVSHALHDALHWLQNVESKVYDDLAEGAVELVVDAEGIKATVSADIMKAVNGVEQELNEVVSTIEEYASVVANVIVTIVEQSFLYKLIEDIIALISLFRHLEDIKNLRASLGGRFDDILKGNHGQAVPALPASFSSWNLAQTYLGSGNSFNDQTTQLDVSSVTNELTTGLLDLVSGNPFAKKIINKVVGSVTEAVDNNLPTPPISFSAPESIIDEAVDDIEDLIDVLVTGVAGLTVDVIEDVIQQLSEDLADPQQSFKNLISGLSTVADQVAVDVLEPVFSWIDGVVTQAPADAAMLLDEAEPFINIDLTALADLLHLFGIGESSNGKLTVSASDAIFYPAALIIWVAVYTKTGKSISDVTELEGSSAQVSGELALTDSTDFELFKIGQLAVDFIVAAQAAGVWAITAETPEDEITGDTWTAFAGVRSWFNLLRRIVDVTEFVSELAEKQKTLTGDTAPDFAHAMLRLDTALLELVFTQSSGKNPGAGWPLNPKPTDILSACNALFALSIMGWDTYQVVKSQPDENDILKIVGSDLGRSQPIATLAWSLTDGGASELLPIFAAYIAFSPYGFILQAEAVSGALGAPGDSLGRGLGLNGGLGSCPRNKGRGKEKGKGKGRGKGRP